jgi:hypothetical protein
MEILREHTSREALNPYRFGLSQILWRLRWDLTFRSWTERRYLKSVKNTHNGEKAVILCNGPSLNLVDFDRLQGVFVVGLNKINLLFNRTNMRPDMIVATNPSVITQNRAFYENTEIPLFLSSRAYTRGLIKTSSAMHFIHSALVPGFARDCSVSINPSHTVTATALQLIFHLGFKQVALVGLDHNFAVKGPSNALISGVSEDFSHFDPTYFADVAWELPDLVESEIGYMRAKEAFEGAGRLVVNATEGGCLEVFERMHIDKFLAL